MRNHYYKYLLCILLLVACVLLVTLAVLSSNPGNGKDGTASTHAPDNSSTYWDKDRVESASPAPMPK